MTLHSYNCLGEYDSRCPALTIDSVTLQRIQCKQ